MKGKELKRFAMKARWYWFRFNGLRLTIHLLNDHELVWTRIRGVQIGNWFFGAVRGQDYESAMTTGAVDPHADSTGTPTPREKGSAMTVEQFREALASMIAEVRVNSSAPVDLDALVQRVADARQDWQPIETAPKDGTAILGFFPQRMGYIARQDAIPIYWRGHLWANSTSGHDIYDGPTRWMPLPAPPAAKETP